MKKLSILLIISMFGTMASAKTPKADRLFNNWEYSRAAKLYEKEAAKHPDTDVYFKLGECYRKMNMYKEELAAYDKVNAAGTYTISEFYLNYGQALKSNGRYDDAKIAFNKYSELVPSDPRGKFFSQSIDIVTADHKNDETIAITNVAALNSENSDFCPVIYKDGIVFSSSRKTAEHPKIYGWTGTNYLDLYYAKKGNSDLNYSEVTPFGGKNANKKYHDGPACFSKNSDTMYVSRVEKYLKGDDKKTLKIERTKIFISTMTDGEWTKGTLFPVNSDSFSVANPLLTADGSRIYFVSDMPGGYGKTDIYYCTKEGNGWSKPVNMGPTINTFNTEKFPALDSVGNFYFSSDGYQGFGGLDICVAINKNGSFEKAVPMKYPFNSVTDDYGITFLRSGKSGYICSNRYEGSRGDDDIFYFNLLKDSVDSNLVTSMYIIGYVKPEKTADVLAEIPKPKDTLADANDPSLFFKNASPEDLRIYFDFDKSNIRPDAIVFLDKVVNYMKQFPNLTLAIGGHCDSRGTEAYNIVLSNKRNRSAIAYLNSKGISNKRLVAKGYGFSQLVNNCVKGVFCTDAEEQLNRRVEFHFKEKK